MDDHPIYSRPLWKTFLIWLTIAALVVATIWVWADVLIGAPASGGLAPAVAIELCA